MQRILHLEKLFSWNKGEIEAFPYKGNSVLPEQVDIKKQKITWIRKEKVIFLLHRDDLIYQHFKSHSNKTKTANNGRFLANAQFSTKYQNMQRQRCRIWNQCITISCLYWWKQSKKELKMIKFIVKRKTFKNKFIWTVVLPCL